MIPSSNCPECGNDGVYIGLYTERHDVDDFSKYDLFECNECKQTIKLFGEELEVDYQWLRDMNGKTHLVEREDLV